MHCNTQSSFNTLIFPPDPLRTWISFLPPFWLPLPWVWPSAWGLLQKTLNQSPCFCSCPFKSTFKLLLIENPLESSSSKRQCYKGSHTRSLRKMAYLAFSYVITLQALAQNNVSFKSFIKVPIHLSFHNHLAEHLIWWFFQCPQGDNWTYWPLFFRQGNWGTPSLGCSLRDYPGSPGVWPGLGAHYSIPLLWRWLLMAWFCHKHNLTHYQNNELTHQKYSQSSRTPKVGIRFPCWRKEAFSASTEDPSLSAARAPLPEVESYKPSHLPCFQFLNSGPAQ